MIGNAIKHTENMKLLLKIIYRNFITINKIIVTTKIILNSEELVVL